MLVVFNLVSLVALWRLVRTARVVAFVRGEASSGGSQKCVSAIIVPTLAVLPPLLANSFLIGSPCFVMSTHLFAELDVMMCNDFLSS